MREKSGLTLVEILTVLAIIALLTGILIPAVSAVKKAAKEVKQRGQFATIEIGLTAFKNDYGDYPQSYFGSTTLRTGIYCGSHKLSEALLGWDLLGFHPNSQFRRDGNVLDPASPTGLTFVYDPTAGLSARKGPYLESGTEYAFTLDDLYPTNLLAGQPGMDRFVLCDVFGVTKVSLSNGSVVKAGAPVLYYRADPSGRFNDASLASAMTPIDNQGNVYNYLDNDTIVQIKEAVDGATTRFDENAFYRDIKDPKIMALSTPYNPSSYILISAGTDGTYGTEDDIRNFGN